MAKNRDSEADSSGRKSRVVVTNIMRAILLIALFIGYTYSRNLILIFSIIGLFVTFLPYILSRMFKREVPASFEIMLLLFVYGLLYYGKIKGFYDQFLIVDVLLTLSAAFIFGLIGLTLSYALYREESLKANPFVIAIFAFCFAVSIGVLWECLEFGLDYTLGFHLQKSAFDTMKDVLANVAGSAFVSSLGYFYLKTGKIIFVSSAVEKLVHKHAYKIGVNKDKEQLKEHVKRIIDKGENNKIEFKSTLRTNVHTKQVDKNVEHATIKTMAGYLNSDGGTLIIGVDDSRNILGIEQDNFVSHDNLALHLTSLIKDHIGAEFLPFINFEIVDLDGKYIIKVDCDKSNKEVFVKNGKDEHFYVRNGPSTAMLGGRELVEYINNRFK